MENLLWSALAQSAAGDGKLNFAMMIDKVARVPISKIVIFAVVLTVFRLAVYAYLKNTPIHLREGIYSFAKFANDLADALIYAAIVVFMLVRPFAIQTFFIPSASMVDTLRIGDFIIANKFIYRASEPVPGDIVVFKPVDRAYGPQTEPDSDFIKRLIGGPGDLVTFDKYVLYRNGQEVTEPYKVLTKNTPTHDEVFPQEDIDRIAKTWSYPDVVNLPKFKLIQYKGDIVPMFYNDEPGREQLQIYPYTKDNVDLDGDAAKELISEPAEKIPAGKYLMVGDNRNGSDDGRFWGLIPRENIIGKAEFVWMPLAHAKKLKNHEAYNQPK